MSFSLVVFSLADPSKMLSFVDILKTEIRSRSIYFYPITLR